MCSGRIRILSKCRRLALLLPLEVCHLRYCCKVNGPADATDRSKTQADACIILTSFPEAYQVPVVAEDAPAGEAPPCVLNRARCTIQARSSAVCCCVCLLLLPLGVFLQGGGQRTTSSSTAACRKGLDSSAASILRITICWCATPPYTESALIFIAVSTSNLYVSSSARLHTYAAAVHASHTCRAAFALQIQPL